MRRQHRLDTAVGSSDPLAMTTLSPTAAIQPARISKQAEMRAGSKSASVVIAASDLRAERWIVLSNDVWRIRKMHRRSSASTSTLEGRTRRYQFSPHEQG